MKKYRHALLLALLFPLLAPAPVFAQCTFSNTAEVSDPTDCQANDGSIDILPMSGTPPFTYLWSNSSTNSTISGLAPGRYTVVITDAASCIKRDTFDLAAPPEVSASVIAAVICFGGSDGSLKASGQCGQRNSSGSYYQYKWYKVSGSTGTLLPTQTDSIATGLDAGTYYAVIRDVNNDTARSADVALTQAPRIVPSASATPVSCYGGATGSVTLGATGGTGTYTYAQGGSAYQGGGLFSGLSAGAAVFHVKDAAGCIRDTAITIAQPPAVGVTASVSPVVCFGAGTGSITITASGGTPGYTYALGTGSYSTSGNFSALPAGTYVLHSKDAAGCVKDTTITVSQPPRIVPAAAVTNVTCFGNADGAVSLTAAGGAGAYTFAQDAGAYMASGTFTALAAGAYTFHVKDAAGCIRDTAVTITQPARIIPAAGVTGVACFGDAAGSVTISATGGAGAYAFARDAGAYGSSGTFAALPAGTYTFHIKDADGCIRDTALTVAQPARIVPAAAVTNVTCFGDAGGATNISATGGTGAFTYAKDAGTYAASGSFTALTTGSYTFHVKDGAGCIRDTAITITQPARILPAAGVTDVACFGDAGGSVTITASGGTGAYTFAKDVGAYGASGAFTTLAAGAYIFHIKDAAGCIRDTSISIAQPARIVPAAAVTNVSCKGGSDGSVAITATGGTGAYTFALGSGAYSANGTFGGLAAGAYLFHVKDAAGCVRDTALTVTEPPLLTLSLSTAPVSCFGGADGAITAAVSGGTSPYHYEWSDGDTAVALSGIRAGAYFLVIKDARGCEALGSAIVASPDTIRLMPSVTAPSCHGFCDGAISLQPSGGTAPYTYQWGNGATSKDLTGLCAGDYAVTLRDAKSCAVTAAFRLDTPSAVTVNAGPDKRLCKTGTLTLKAISPDSNALFRWTGSTPGFSADTANLVVSQPGAYYVTATADGCSGSDTVIVTQTAQDFDAEFVAASQAFKDSLYSLVNISSPEPDTVVWVLPATTGVVVVSRSKYLAEVIFRDTGVYVVSMTGRSGQCEKTVENRVVVVAGQPYTPVAGNPRRAYIRTFTIAPNPTGGQFEVHVELDEEGPVRLRLISLQSSAAADDRQDGGRKEYHFSYNLSLQSGQYLLLLETAHGSQSLKLTIR